MIPVGAREQHGSITIAMGVLISSLPTTWTLRSRAIDSVSHQRANGITAPQRCTGRRPPAYSIIAGTEPLKMSLPLLESEPQSDRDWVLFVPTSIAIAGPTSTLPTT